MKVMADREKGKELTGRLCSLWYGKGFFEEAMMCKKRNYAGMSDIDRAVMVYTHKVLITPEKVIVVVYLLGNTGNRYNYIYHWFTNVWTGCALEI